LTRAAGGLLALALTLALAGCETTAEQSARLEREAARGGASAARGGGLSIARESRLVEVVQETVLHSPEGSAVVLRLRNRSGTALRDVPLAVTVRDARGAVLYTNSTPGLARTLVSAPLLGAHGELTWIDDQVQGAGAPVSVSAKVGEAPAFSGPIPRIAVEGAHLVEDPSNGLGAEGTVANRSGVVQRELVVYALAERAGRIVAAGRAVLAQAPAGASTRFQVFFIGDPRGARLRFDAPASTLR
jgi:hypothetical protein